MRGNALQCQAKSEVGGWLVGRLAARSGAGKLPYSPRGESGRRRRLPAPYSQSIIGPEEVEEEVEEEEDLHNFLHDVVDVVPSQPECGVGGRKMSQQIAHFAKRPPARSSAGERTKFRASEGACMAEGTKREQIFTFRLTEHFPFPR